MHGHALDVGGTRPHGARSAAVDDARRDDVDRVSCRDGALVELACRPDRASERDGGPVGGRERSRMRRRSLIRRTLTGRLAFRLVSSENGTSSRPRLLVLNQYYWPGVEATANLLTELCEALAEDYEVTVIAGATQEAVSGREVRNGVHIVRVHSTSYDRTQLSRRAANYLTYLLGSVRDGLGDRAARCRRLHDRPAVHRRGRRARRAAVQRAARRDQPGRLPGDRGRGPAAPESAADRASVPARPLLPHAARTGSLRSARRCGGAWRRRARRRSGCA